MINTVKTRLNITLPSALVADLKLYARDNISKFIEEAVEETIHFKKRKEAIRLVKKFPPSFTQVKDSVKFVRKLRSLDTKRLKEIGIA